MTAELDDVPFSVVRRGYDRAQVEDRLNRLSAELDAAAAGRNAAVDDVRTLTRQRDASRNETQAARAANAEARSELERLRTQVAELSIIPHTVDGMSERLQQMVRIAQDEVNDMRSRATAGAAQVLTLAQAEADELRERSNVERREFEAERRVAEESLRSQLEESQTRLDQLRHDSDGQMARLDSELADRRSRAEQALAGQMDERRVTMHNELAAQETRHREEAARILEAANSDARSRLAEATAEAQRVRSESRTDVIAAQRELEELRVLQHQISEQLTSVRALLDWTLPQIAASQVAASQKTASQITASQAAPSQIAPSHTGPAQVGAVQAGPAQVAPAASRTPENGRARPQPVDDVPELLTHAPQRSDPNRRGDSNRDDPARAADGDRTVKRPTRPESTPTPSGRR